MKLSKKNAARQRILQKAIASGKTLGGLLVGLTAATVVSGCKDSSPASTMGSYPRPRQQANSTNENTEEFATLGDIAGPEDITEPKPKTPQPKPNVMRERQDNEIVLGGCVLPPPSEDRLPFRPASVIMSQLLPTNKTQEAHFNKRNSKEDDVKVEVDL